MKIKGLGDGFGEEMLLEGGIAEEENFGLAERSGYLFSNPDNVQRMIQEVWGGGGERMAEDSEVLLDFSEVPFEEFLGVFMEDSFDPEQELRLCLLVIAAGVGL